MRAIEQYMNILPDREARAGLAGQTLRGVQRLLRAAGYASISEAPLSSGRRADVLAVGPGRGEIVIAEIKSSRADFLSDHKWREYRPWCDQFFFAIPPGLDPELMPPEEGLIIADAWGGEIMRAARKRPLAAARRKAVILLFAQLAAQRLHDSLDPQAGRGLI